MKPRKRQPTKRDLSGAKFMRDKFGIGEGAKLSRTKDTEHHKLTRFGDAMEKGELGWSKEEHEAKRRDIGNHSTEIGLNPLRILKLETKMLRELDIRDIGTVGLGKLTVAEQVAENRITEEGEGKKEALRKFDKKAATMHIASEGTITTARMHASRTWEESVVAAKLVHEKIAQQRLKLERKK